MQFEAKNDGSGNPTSIEANTPWVSITQANAKSECESLNALNGVTNKYDLISNPEWITIARNLENVDGNWTDNNVGSGCIKRGNIGGTNPCTGGNSGYAVGAADFGAGRSDNGTAQLTLNTGAVIWDFSGNVYEWVDWTLGGTLDAVLAQGDKPYDNTDTGPVALWRELDVIDIFTGRAPSTALLPSDPTFNTSQGVGSYLSGLSGGVPLRGGAWNTGTDAGIFTLSLDDSPASVETTSGFRCVFRP